MGGCLGMLPRSSQRWGSGEASRGQAGQAEVGVGEEAEVDGVAIEADVLQRPADVAVVLAVAERVLVHGLDVVVLEGESGMVQGAPHPTPKPMGIWCGRGAVSHLEVQGAQALGQGRGDVVQLVIGQMEELQLLQVLWEEAGGEAPSFQPRSDPRHHPNHPLPWQLWAKTSLVGAVGARHGSVPAASPSTHPKSFGLEPGAGDPVETGVQPDDAAGQLGQRRQPVLGQDELLQAGQEAESIRVRPGDGIARQVYSLQLLWWERERRRLEASHIASCTPRGCPSAEPSPPLASTHSAL